MIPVSGPDNKLINFNITAIIIICIIITIDFISIIIINIIIATIINVIFIIIIKIISQSLLSEGFDICKKKKSPSTTSQRTSRNFMTRLVRDPVSSSPCHSAQLTSGQMELFRSKFNKF
ncbi:hypothetical protein BgiBS90_013152 [Biomphalaria glabrata]|nr:hypothetical protein BgiBS90_013152 [Biomphalaria glabrata]